MNAEEIYHDYWASGLHAGRSWDDEHFQRWFGVLAGKERVLDYGCGMGFSYQERLIRVVKDYVGADISDVALADLRRKGLGALQINGKDGTLDSPANAFDAAICSEVFEHLYDPLAAAREIHRVLKPGGLFVTTVPNFGYHTFRLLALLRAQVPSEPESLDNRFKGVHIRFFSKLMFQRLLQGAGFENISVGSYDLSSVWDVFGAAGHLGAVTDIAKKHLPSPFHLRFLQDIWPNVFAMRLRAVAFKPK